MISSGCQYNCHSNASNISIGTSVTKLVLKTGMGMPDACLAINCFPNFHCPQLHIFSLNVSLGWFLMENRSRSNFLIWSILDQIDRVIYQIYLVLDPGPKVQNIKIHLIIPYQESIIDVIWRPKTIGIHFVARFITEKLPKTSEVLKLIFLNNLETN